MRWKQGVVVQNADKCQFTSSNMQKDILPEDEYIVQAVESGVSEDEELIRIIMEKEDVDEIVARLRIAQFVIEHGEYIAELEGHMMIEA